MTTHTVPTVDELNDLLADLADLNHGHPHAVAREDEILATKRRLVARLRAHAERTRP